jgi:hypoxanthine phosphoribosyltransferase
MKLITYNWDKVNRAVQDIAMGMFKDNWRPDYIVGITRGGLVPAVMLSHMTDIPMHTLCVQLGAEGLEENTESNCWMSEDAFGYVSVPDRDNVYSTQTADPEKAKNILIIDDINRGGDAMEWIMKDWQSGCLPDSERWDQVWHNNVRFASLLSNPNSVVDTDYWSAELPDDEESWVEFPWEV